MQMGCGYSVPFEDGFTEMETVLPAPHNLRLRKTTHGKECLCWDAPNNLVTSYYLYGYTYSSKHMDFVREVSAKRTAFYLSELPITQNIENTFGVQAIYGQNESNLSYIKLRPPSFPFKASVDISDSVIFLSWKPPHDDGGAPITHYEIYWCSYFERQMFHMETLGDVYHYQIPYVKDKTKRIYGIQARNIIGEGPITTVTAKVSTSGNRKTKSKPPLTNKTEKDFSASDNNPPDSDKDTPRSVYVSTYQHDFGKHCDMQGYLPPLDSKNKIRHLNGKDNETEKPGDRKTKSKPPVTSKTDKDVIASKNDPTDSDKDTPEKATYVSTYHHEFRSHCDIGGCSIPLTDDSALLTLQCQHKICYDCYDKVLPFLQKNKIFQAYEFKCMVCGVYSSVELYQDDKNNIIYLQCRETNAEKTMKADLAHSTLKDSENKIRYLTNKDNETEIPGDRKTKSKPPVTNMTNTDVIASKNDPSDSDKDTPEKATNFSALYDEFGKHCDMRGCVIPLTDETVVLTLQCQHKICFNCYDKVQPFLRQNEIFQTYEIKCMVCGVYSSVDICRDDKNNIIYLQCRETNAEKTMKADLVHSKLKGIPNIGSTCYANCILQVLGQTPNLVPSLQHMVDQFSNKKKIPISSMLLTILQKFECDDGMYVDTRLIQDLITEIHSIDQSFERFRQNDCHSFLICLFNGIQDEIISAQGELKNKMIKNPLEMFEGKMCNYFEYLPCNHSETTEDQVFTSLLVPIQENKTNGQQEQWSIEKGLQLMMGSEKFDGEVLPCLKCENTCLTSPGKKITTKTFGISEPPAILILQLGRFREVRGRLRKVDCDITYEKNLDFEVINHRTQIPACVKYKLYSVVLHYGSLESGHYYSYVKSKTSDQWFYCSDRYVRKVQDPFEWGFREAYLLFYRRSNY